jgi:hypothetical protein
LSCGSAFDVVVVRGDADADADADDGPSGGGAEGLVDFA